MSHTVLLVDDSASMVAQLSESIQFHDPEFVVLGASNGQKAIEVLESREVDVLVTDLAMPVMDGFELLGYVKRRKPNLPFIVISSMPYDRAGWRLSPFGTTPFMTKPVDPEKLVEQMRSLLREVSAGRIVGVTLPNLLQLLEWERKSCSVRIATEDGRWGRLHFLSGQLVNAYAADTGSEGEAAALRMLAWEASDIELERSYHNHEQTIRRPLQELLIDSAREADEEEARRTGQWPAVDLDDALEAAAPPAAPEPDDEPDDEPDIDLVTGPIEPAETDDEPDIDLFAETVEPAGTDDEPDIDLFAETVEPAETDDEPDIDLFAETVEPAETAAAEPDPAPAAPAPQARQRDEAPRATEPDPTALLERRIDALAEALDAAARALSEARAELDGLRAERRRPTAASTPEVAKR